MKRISLTDCPGIVPPSQNDSPEDLLLRGGVRDENVECRISGAVYAAGSVEV